MQDNCILKNYPYCLRLFDRGDEKEGETINYQHYYRMSGTINQPEQHKEITQILKKRNIEGSNQPKPITPQYSFPPYFFLPADRS